MTSTPMWRYLLALFRYIPLLCLTHATLWAIVNASTLAYGLLISRLIGNLEANQGAGRIVLAFAGLGIGQSVFWLLAGRSEIAMRFRMSGVVRRNLLRMLLAIPGAVALERSVGDTISRFRDDAYLAEDVMDWTDEIIAQLVIALSALGVMLWIDPALTVLTVVPTLLIILGARLMGRRLADLRRASSDATSRFTSTVGDVIASATTIQAAGASDHALHHISGLAAVRRSTTVKDQVLNQGVKGVTTNASALGTGLVMLLAATRIREGQLSVADFVLFTAWFGLVTNTAVEFGLYFAQMMAARVGFERMEAITQRAPAGMSVVDHTPLHLSGPLPEEPIVKAPSPTVDRLVQVKAPGGTFALAPGGITAITGRIGAGKTTLLRGLLGLAPLDDVHLRGIDPANTGYVPQVPRLFSGTVRENILLGRDVPEARLHAAVELAVLREDIARFPQGLESMVGARGLQVSGGQAQRIALARALVGDPQLLVVDDLSSALDVDTERAMWQGLATLPDLAILAVTHRRFVLQRADQVVVMQRGEIEAVGSLPDVLGRSAEMQALWAEDES